MRQPCPHSLHPPSNLFEENRRPRLEGRDGEADAALQLRERERAVRPAAPGADKALLRRPAVDDCRELMSRLAKRPRGERASSQHDHGEDLPRVNDGLMSRLADRQREPSAQHFAKRIEVRSRRAEREEAEEDEPEEGDTPVPLW